MSSYDMAPESFDSNRHQECRKEKLLGLVSDMQTKIDQLDISKLQLQKQDLQNQVKDLREKVKDTCNGDFQSLEDQIQNLKKEVEYLRYRNVVLTRKHEKLVDSLAMAQATWVWEAHLARFVVQPGEDVKLTRRFRQMTDHEKSRRTTRWRRIQTQFGKWTGLHWEMVNVLRHERRYVAHPDIDLDAIEDFIPKLEEAHQTPMRDMLRILKLTASLMKFGRLAKFYEMNKKNFPLLKLEGKGEDALRLIVSWDRNFEEIDGLQKIEHEEAKTYMESYVNDPGMFNHYVKIVDFIKQANSKRLGKLAWAFEKRHSFTNKMLPQEIQALNEMKKLLPNPDGERNVTALDPAIAMLHIPDFLPKKLWGHATNLIENY